MARTALDQPAPLLRDRGAQRWSSLADLGPAVPEVLRPWLAEPGLLTARVRAACGEATTLRMLSLEHAAIDPLLRAVLGVGDAHGLVREVEIGCGGTRWIYAQSVFPDSTVERYPWLGELGDNGLGESLARVADVRREPLEYAELHVSHPLACAARAPAGEGRALWARRAVYRLGGLPILVQEVFLPGLGRCG